MHPAVLAIPITVLWIVGITNAVNLIDGLDGLACGVSTISSKQVSKMGRPSMRKGTAKEMMA